MLAPTTVIQPFPLIRAAEWQRDIVQACRRHGGMNPKLHAWLADRRLAKQCTVLASDPDGGPLIFRHLGAPVLGVLGDEWGRSVLHRPEAVDPYEEYSASVSQQYAAAIDSGDILHNHITTMDSEITLSYSQVLIGWQLGRQRIVLSATHLFLH